MALYMPNTANTRKTVKLFAKDVELQGFVSCQRQLGNRLDLRR